MGSGMRVGGKSQRGVVGRVPFARILLNVLCDVFGGEGSVF
jgi:hypothetical protein